MGALAVAVAVCWGCSSGVRDECLQLLREGKATRRGQSLLTKCWHFLTTSRGQAINRMVLHTPNPSLRKLAGPDTHTELLNPTFPDSGEPPWPSGRPSSLGVGLPTHLVTAADCAGRLAVLKRRLLTIVDREADRQLGRAHDSTPTS